MFTLKPLHSMEHIRIIIFSRFPFLTATDSSIPTTRCSHLFHNFHWLNFHSLSSSSMHCLHDSPHLPHLLLDPPATNDWPDYTPHSDLRRLCPAHSKADKKSLIQRIRHTSPQIIIGRNEDHPRG